MTKLIVAPEKLKCRYITRVKWANTECNERRNACEILVGTPKRRRTFVNVGTFEYENISAVQVF